MSSTGKMPKFNLVQDVMSGVIMAMTSVPQLIAYAELVGYASHRGLTTAGPSLAFFTFFTGVPFLNTGVTSLTAVMAKSDLGGDAFLAEHGEEAYAKLVAAYSLMVGITSLILAAVGVGNVAQNLVPKPVQAGFKWGCAANVVVSAVPTGLLMKGSSTLKSLAQSAEMLRMVISTIKGLPVVGAIANGAVSVSKVIYTIASPFEWYPLSAAIFFGSTYFIMNSKSIASKVGITLPPGADVIMVTVFTTLLSTAISYDGGVVGAIPTIDASSGISLFDGKLILPVTPLNVKELLFDAGLVEEFGGSWVSLIFTASVFSVIGFLSTVGICLTFESENGHPWSATRELGAQGMACLAAGATGSAPVGASLSRSLVARMTGTTSSCAALVTAMCWMLLLPFMSVMSPTPKCALSAIIVSAVVKGVAQPKQLMALKGPDFVVGWTTAMAVLLLSPTLGFGVGLVLSFVIGFAVPKTKKD